MLSYENSNYSICYTSEMDLDEAYAHICKNPSDIFKHCPRLKQLASECKHVTELGCRSGRSTTAILAGQPETFITYDIDEKAIEQVREKLIPIKGRTTFCAEVGNSLEITLHPTDMLFIDTYHVYSQLLKELQKHHSQVSKYIVCHDTKSFGYVGEDGRLPGLMNSINDFIKEHPEWKIKVHYPGNNGLTVLDRT